MGVQDCLDSLGLGGVPASLAILPESFFAVHNTLMPLTSCEQDLSTSSTVSRKLKPRATPGFNLLFLEFRDFQGFRDRS